MEETIHQFIFEIHFYDPVSQDFITFKNKILDKLNNIL